MLTKRHGLGAVLAACSLLAACTDAPDEAAQGAEPRGTEEQAQVATSGDQVPCDVAKIVTDHCINCHGASPSFGAPFSLMTVADFQKTTFSGQPVHQSANARVQLNGPGRMPPTSSDAIPPADLAKLTSWLGGGARGVANGCQIGQQQGGGTQTTTQTVEPGRAYKDPIDYNDPNLKCYKFTAYASPSRKDQPYSVSTQPDAYVNFVFQAPWRGTQYIRSFRAIVDNKAVIHHWLFFRNLRPQREGASPSSGVHPNDEMLFGWAPGGDDMYFSPDVAMEAPSGTYTVENHYNNRTGRPAPDASGVEICVTPTRPQKVAGLAWVGTDAISGTSARGTCRPNTNQTAHIIATQPHMHTKGRHMTVTLNKRGGGSEVVHDQPFDFNYQRMYLTNITVNPGDSLNTVCQYSSPARFGPATNDEMCYYFSIHWPAGALRSGGIGQILHGPNSCL